MRPARPRRTSSCRVARRAPLRSEPTELSGLFSADSVWNRPDVGSQPARRSTACPGTRPGGGQRDQARRSDRGSRRSDDSTPIYVRRTGSAVRARCISTSPRPTARRCATHSRASHCRRTPVRRPGSDAHLTLIQPSTDSMWEFWHLRRDGDAMARRLGWRDARHLRRARATTPPTRGPAHRHLGARPRRACRGGWDDDDRRAGARPNRPRVGHRHPQRQARACSRFPRSAQMERSAPRPAIPEGTEFRLDPKLDMRLAASAPGRPDRWPRPHSDTGIIVRDKTCHAIGFFAEDPTPLGTNPYTQLFDGKSPGVLLQRFPWKYLQAVKTDPQIQYRPKMEHCDVPFRVNSATATRSLARPGS